jgi:hypothetical protein
MKKRTGKCAGAEIVRSQASLQDKKIFEFDQENLRTFIQYLKLHLAVATLKRCFGHLSEKFRLVMLLVFQLFNYNFCARRW